MPCFFLRPLLETFFSTSSTQGLRSFPRFPSSRVCSMFFLSFLLASSLLFPTNVDCPLLTNTHSQESFRFGLGSCMGNITEKRSLKYAYAKMKLVCSTEFFIFFFGGKKKHNRIETVAPCNWNVKFDFDWMKTGVARDLLRWATILWDDVMLDQQ